MITYKEKTEIVKETEKIICDVCKKEFLYNNENIMEIQEFHHINFRGGFESVFGDDVEVRLDICQHCLKEKLGQYMRFEEEK